MTMQKTPITVAYGDGIGPEIMKATLDIILAAGAELEIEEIKIGEQLYLQGLNTGIEPSSWASLRRTKVFLKAPITTPQGGGFKSLNVTTRKVLGLYANVRPCQSYFPYVHTKHPKMNVVIVRENEEDLYAGVEHRQTNQVYQCLKLITQPGSEKIIRYAFEYARANNRKKVSVFVKDNIMKMTDGLFHKIFDDVAKEYPDLENEAWIVDIGAAKLADTPEIFDVIVMPNLYGDILSDVAAQITGSVGLAGSANLGENCAMFEAIHGSAPKRAGQNLANPSGILLGAVMMLVHIKQAEVAMKVHNAWLYTMEQGIHTYDIFREGVSTQKVGTKEFALAVIANLGKLPQTIPAVTYSNFTEKIKTSFSTNKQVKKLVGSDVFLDWDAGSADDLGAMLKAADLPEMALTVISNRGVKVWPNGMPETFCTDHWRCRFLHPENKNIAREDIINLLTKITSLGYDVIKTENLYTFDGENGFSSIHG